jgi:hypothetical protein
MDVFRVLPKTFSVNGIEDSEFEKFSAHFSKISERIEDFHKKRQQDPYSWTMRKKQYNIWILKPGENANRGEGIQVLDSY